MEIEPLKELQREFDRRRLEHIGDRALFEELETRTDVPDEIKQEGKVLFAELEVAWKEYESKYTKMMEAAGIILDKLDELNK